MTGRITFAVAGRVLTQLRRDRRTMVMLLFLPTALMTLLWWMFKDVPGVVFDRVGPGLLALFPFFIMFLVTSITTLRERSGGTLERLLSMPMGKLDFLFGYALAFGADGRPAVGGRGRGQRRGLLGMDVLGPVWLLTLVAVADAVLGTALGLFVSALRADGVPGRAVHAGRRGAADAALRAAGATRPAPPCSRRSATCSRCRTPWTPCRRWCGPPTPLRSGETSASWPASPWPGSPSVPRHCVGVRRSLRPWRCSESPCSCSPAARGSRSSSPTMPVSAGIVTRLRAGRGRPGRRRGDGRPAGRRAAASPSTGSARTSSTARRPRPRATPTSSCSAPCTRRPHPRRRGLREALRGRPGPARRRREGRARVRPRDLRGPRRGRHHGDPRHGGPHHHRLHPRHPARRCAPTSRGSAPCCRPTCAVPSPTAATSPRRARGCGCARAPTRSPSRSPSRTRPRSTAPTSAA